MSFRHLLSFLLLFSFFGLYAQEPNPVAWTFDSKSLGNGEYEINFKAKIITSWYVYSQAIVEDGPIPTSFHITPAPGLKLIGKATEKSSHVKQGIDPVFEKYITKYAEEVTFTQRIKADNPAKPISGYLEYMTCDNEKCLPPKEVKFNITLPAAASASGGMLPSKGIPLTQDPKLGQVKGADTAEVAATPTADTATVAVAQEAAPEVVDSTALASVLSDIANLTFDKTDANTTCGDAPQKEESDESLLWIFLLGMGGGFIALLTPCVFPLIPLTVGFFTKRSKDRKTGIRNAITYGLSIIAIYTGLGLLITFLFGADALNQLSTNVWFNVILFLMLIVFAFSFFGYFELTLPASWANKMDAMSDKGGYLGIFFMAFTLAIVSFSCTGPLIGNLLVLAVDKTASGIPLKPIVGMFGFSLALALPFALFSFFPGWLQNLPRSGNWMDDVKVTLGFAEIALAFKFLSVADLTMNWKIVPYELFIGVWVLCALGLALYFLNKLRFPHTARRISLPNGHKVMAALSLIMAVYFGTGFMKHERVDSFVTPSLLSGLAPPAGHSYIYPRDCPLDLNCYHDFEEGMAVARAENKPVLIDFTGYGCVNCRKMEDNVWSKDKVFKVINDEYVLISLYTDDRKLLSKTIELPDRTLRNVGNKWAWFEEKYFDRVSQPYYVLLSPDLKFLNKPVGYTPDETEYLSFLNCGVERFKALKK